MAKMQHNRSGRGGFARIMSLILVILMLLGTASTIILVLLSSNSVASAAGYTEPIMSIGIQYGDMETGSYRTYSETGYTIVSQKPDGDRSAVKLGNVTEKTLIVASNGNLAPSGTGFAVASSGVTVGGYRVDSSKTYSTYAEAESAAAAVRSALSAKGMQVFSAYLNGKFRVRVGCFKSQTEANNATADVKGILGTDVTVGAPSSNAVSVLTSAGKVVFEYENGTSAYLGLKPAGSGEVYLKTDNNHIYEGTFMYRRSGNLIRVINMIGLETYIEGVLPYEISSSWPIESQKAFAIAARSFAVGNRGRHNSAYGFDLCPGTNCQVYKGAGSVTDLVKKAVADTSGKVITYNGKAVSLTYSSSTGGCTVSAKDCWGGSGSPYMQAVSTPWERYANYGNGFWTYEVSPAELCEYLRGKGYTTLTGKIASVEITATGENSTYVKGLKITDTAGHSVTLTNTDNIRITLTKYLKSANFVVGKGSVAYTVSSVTASTETLPYNVQDMSSVYVMTAGGKVHSAGGAGTYVASGSGSASMGSSSGCVLTASNVNGGGDTVSKGYAVTHSNKTATASNPDNFIFVGKGWGHGVGLSQYGTKDLADFGYTYEKILEMYVPTAKIKHLSDM